MAPSLLIYEAREWRNVHQETWGGFTREKIQSSSLWQRTSRTKWIRMHTCWGFFSGFFFFLTLKNKHFCSSQISTFLKAKEYAELPQVSEKKKKKARIKICRISSYIYPSSSSLCFSVQYTQRHTYTHSIHTTTQASEKKGPFHLKYNR